MIKRSEDFTLKDWQEVVERHLDRSRSDLVISVTRRGADVAALKARNAELEGKQP